MKHPLRKIVTGIERRISPLLGKVLWPPTGANVVCWTNEEKNELVLLDVDGTYNFPAGMIEHGEHPREAAEREFKEETGMEAEIKEFLGVKTVWNGIHGLHFFYEATLDSDFENRSSGWEGEPTIVEREEVSELLDQLPDPKET